MVEMMKNILEALEKIETRGESTLIMAQCVQALGQVYQQMAREEQAKKENAAAPTDPSSEMED